METEPINRNTIIVVYGEKNEGKSQTVRNCYSLLLTEHEIESHKFLKEMENDIFLHFDIYNTRIGFHSESVEPMAFGYRTGLESLILEERSNIIICATNYHQANFHLINGIADRQRYRLIWMSTIACNDFDHEKLNMTSARNICEIVSTLLPKKNTNLTFSFLFD